MKRKLSTDETARFPQKMSRKETEDKLDELTAFIRPHLVELREKAAEIGAVAIVFTDPITSEFTITIIRKDWHL